MWGYRSGASEASAIRLRRWCSLRSWGSAIPGVLRFSATTAGLAFVPMAVLMAFGAGISDRVAARIGAHRTVGSAMLLMGAGILRSACSAAQPPLAPLRATSQPHRSAAGQTLVAITE
jgi:hypothetical protein